MVSQTKVVNIRAKARSDLTMYAVPKELRTLLSPLRGLLISRTLYPRLAPWAAFLRRSAAENRLFCSIVYNNKKFSRTH